MTDSTSEAGRTPLPGSRIEHMELGPWVICPEGLFYKGRHKGDMIVAWVANNGGLRLQFIPKGNAEGMVLDISAGSVRSMSRQALARCIARHGYAMAPGAESAVAGYVLAAWNNGAGREHTVVTYGPEDGGQ